MHFKPSSKVWICPLCRTIVLGCYHSPHSNSYEGLGWALYKKNGGGIFIYLFFKYLELINLSTITGGNCAILCYTVLYCGPWGLCHYRLLFLPTPLAVAWVFRLTFFPLLLLLCLLLLLLLLPTSNFLFILGTENAVGGVGPWLCMPSCYS